METNKEKIGARIKLVREELNLTQPKFAELLGVGPKSISAYETGGADTSPSFLAKVAKLSGKSLEWIITGQCSEPEPPPISFLLGEKEQKAIAAAEDLLAHYGLDKRFRVTEINQPAPPTEALSPDAKELLDSWTALDLEYRADVLKYAREKRIVYEATLKKEVVKHLEAAKYQELKEVEAIKADLSTGEQLAGEPKERKPAEQSPIRSGSTALSENHLK